MAQARVAVIHSKPGSYLVQLDGTNVQFTGGDVQVSPVTGSKAHCAVVKSASGPHVKTVVTVHCFDSDGHPVNTAFTIQ